MEVNIQITLTDDDIAEGITAQEAVSRVFPFGEKASRNIQISTDNLVDFDTDPDFAPVVETPPPPTPLVDNPPELDDEDEEPVVQKAPVFISNEQPPELDAAGVPWDGEIHSSGKTKYQSGPDKGRWVWKRGSDEATREAKALELAEQYRGVEPEIVPSEVAVEIPVGAGDYTPPAPPAAPKEAPQFVPPAAPTGQHIDFVSLLQKIKHSGVTPDKLNDALSKAGISQLAQLSPVDAGPIRDQVISLLGLV